MKNFKKLLVISFIVTSIFCYTNKTIRSHSTVSFIDIYNSNGFNDSSI